MAYLLFRQIAVLFVILALGWLTVRLKLLKSRDSHVLSILTIYLIVPCMILKSFQIELTDAVLRGFLLAVAAAVVFQLCLFAVGLAGKRLLGLDLVETLSITYTNCGNLILTLIAGLLGEQWVVYASAFVCTQQILLWTHAMPAFSGTGKPNWKKVITNVNVLSIALGLTLMFAGIRLPAFAMDVVSSLAGTIGPISMLLIGMVLAEADLKTILKTPRIYLVTVLRLIAAPLLCLAVARLTGLYRLAPEGKTVLYIVFLAAMAPSATMVTQFAELFDRRSAYAGSINVITTLLCIVTMPLLTQLYTLWIGL